MAVVAALYIFIDESGNFDFSPRGTRYLVLCAYSTTLPLQHSLKFQQLKYQNLRRGREVECFHASEDNLFLRKQVLAIIAGSQKATFDYVYLPKNKTHPSKQSKIHVYEIMAGALISYIFGRLTKRQLKYDQIIIVIDRSLTNREQNYRKNALKPRLKQFGRPYELFFFQTKSDPNAQVADYGAWAKFVSLQRKNYIPLRALSHLIENDFNVFRKGSKRFY